MAPLLIKWRRGYPDIRVWGFTYPAYLHVLDDIDAVMKVKVVPYQLRHSGANHDRLHRLRSQDEVMKRGRWKTMQSVLRYKKHGRVQVAANNYRAEVSYYDSLCVARLGQFVLDTDRHAPTLPIM